MSGYISPTKKELRQMAKVAQPGRALFLSVRDHAEYLSIRAEMGWPNSRSIHRRLVKKNRLA